MSYPLRSRPGPDYELWQALHRACPEEGCGNCVLLPLVLEDQDRITQMEIRLAAYWAGMTPEAWVHMAVTETLKDWRSREYHPA